MHEFQNLHAQSKARIQEFVRGHFYGYVGQTPRSPERRGRVLSLPLTSGRPEQRLSTQGSQVPVEQTPQISGVSVLPPVFGAVLCPCSLRGVEL